MLTRRGQPFRIRHGIILLQGHYGSHRLTIGVDTGTPRSAINSLTAKALKIGLSPTRNPTTKRNSAFTGASAGSGWLKRIRIGPLTIPRLHLHASNMEHIERALGVKVDLWLGTDFLEGRPITVDYRKRRLLFRKPRAALPEGILVRPTFRKGLAFVRSEIEGKGLNALIDTGASVCVLSTRTAASLKLTRTGRLSRIAAAAGHVKSRAAQLPAFNVAGIRLRSLSVQVVDLSPIEKICRRRVDLILGAPFLRRFQTTLDFSRRRIVFSQFQHRGNQTSPVGRGLRASTGRRTRKLSGNLRRPS